MREVMRQEKKYMITLEEFLQSDHYFSQVLHADPHGGARGYPVRSLYFDSLEDNDFFEKLSGVENRRKIRLRIYDPNDSFAMLEMKQKQGKYQKKRSLRISREDAVSLTQGRYGCLLGYTDPFAAECYGLMEMRCYRPRTIIQYFRKAFIAKENNIRITFDHKIEATESCLDLFHPHLNFDPVLDPFQVVMEVKYNGFLLSYIKEAVNRCSRSELSSSKYCMGRSLGLYRDC
ncbi:polyphosphate polymerase domain-containing protein [Zongyangia hominis]|uniref:Polyphosphate polymerase domain-containing protein n=1 Tax=Zongyangia hominis TaxID=2763677 RepID=A0A926EAR6_9FIRM|nr:polyphosphate polymerase domain-containing protein [Zongyangia hominis]MBC8569560.1 polyphosphate polymerase domain-containing protein [Zongyangia hominis]